MCFHAIGLCARTNILVRTDVVIRGIRCEEEQTSVSINLLDFRWELMLTWDSHCCTFNAFIRVQIYELNITICKACMVSGYFTMKLGFSIGYVPCLLLSDGMAVVVFGVMFGL